MSKIVFPSKSKSYPYLRHLLNAPRGTDIVDLFLPLSKNYKKLPELNNSHGFVIEQSFISVKTMLVINPLAPIGRGGRGVSLMYSCMEVDEYNLIKNFVDSNVRNGTLHSVPSSEGVTAVYIPNSHDSDIKPYLSLSIEYDKGPINNYFITYTLEYN